MSRERPEITACLVVEKGPAKCEQLVREGMRRENPDRMRPIAAAKIALMRAVTPQPPFVGPKTQLG